MSWFSKSKQNISKVEKRVQMNPALLIALLQQVVIPEVTAIIRAHKNATGVMPTDAQVIAALSDDTGKGIVIGEAWLAAHPIVPSNPPVAGGV